MASDRDRAHFERIAEAEAELNSESLRQDARRTPGDNIERGLALSEFAAAFAGDLSRPDEVAPAALWAVRARRQRTEP